MQTLFVELGDRRYPIFIGSHLDPQQLLAPYVHGRQVMLVSNSTVAPLYLQHYVDALLQLDKQVAQCILPDGEQYKDLQHLNLIFDALLEAGFNRDCTVLALGGTLRQLVNNMVVGVTKGFEKKLSLVGVGYKAQAQGAKLNLTVGYSHPVNIDMPAGIAVATPTPTEIVLKGADRQRVGQIAAEVRAVRPPEHDKGIGIRPMAYGQALTMIALCEALQ